MKIAERASGRILETEGESRFQRFLYGNAFGRCLLLLLVRPWVSRLAGAYLSSRASRRRIPGFVAKNAIDMSDYLPEDYASFNDFFSRKIAAGKRTVVEGDLLPAPCDGKLTVLPASADGRYEIKRSVWSLADLFGSEEVAAPFYGGWIFIFRLTVDDYHRYVYPDRGTKGETTAIPGVLHTVNPVAFDRYPVFSRNAREYSLLDTERFGRIAMVEVGALMVGRIVNFQSGACAFGRGEEKGTFAFGGSTVLLVTQPEAVNPDPDLVRFSAEGIETKVRLGERVGRTVRRED